jgi:hypothetical protein
VHMVGHDHPGLQLIEVPARARANDFHYLPRDSCIAQPSVPGAPGQRTILCGERVARSRISDIGWRNGH